jgi:uncharacterized protein (UPF0335 family)
MWEWGNQRSIFEVPCPDIPERLKAFLLSLSFSGNKGGVQEKEQDVSAMFRGGRLDEDLFTVSNSLVKGGMPQAKVQRVLEVLTEHGNKNRDGREPWTPEMVSDKVKSAIQRVERKERNLSQEVRDWVELAEGTFDTWEIEKALRLTDLNDQKNMWAVLDRMVKEGAVDKATTKRGRYRTKHSDFRKMDFTKNTGEILSIRWPLGIEDMYKCYPGSIAVLAGAPGSGKTTYCLNFCLLNMQRSIPMKSYRVTYLSSELGEEELGSRMSLFGYPLDVWAPATFLKVSVDFEDAIDPDGINVVDFLEEYEDFWKISLYMKRINDKLRGGMALIAMQRPFGREVAKGGEGTLEKPRLYLTMSQPPGEDHKIKILKCHNWIDPSNNPKNKMRTFWIKNGSRITPTSEWIVDNTPENPMGFKDFSGRRR